MNGPKPVIIYGTNTCPKCDDLIVQLKAWGVLYEVRDLFSFQGALDDVLNRVGFVFHLPIVKVGSKYVVGHRMDRITEILKSIGYRFDV